MSRKSGYAPRRSFPFNPNAPRRALTPVPVEEDKSPFIVGPPGPILLAPKARRLAQRHLSFDSAHFKPPVDKKLQLVHLRLLNPTDPLKFMQRRVERGVKRIEGFGTVSVFHPTDKEWVILASYEDPTDGKFPIQLHIYEYQGKPAWELSALGTVEGFDDGDFLPPAIWWRLNDPTVASQQVRNVLAGVYDDLLRMLERMVQFGGTVYNRVDTESDTEEEEDEEEEEEEEEKVTPPARVQVRAPAPTRMDLSWLRPADHEKPWELIEHYLTAGIQRIPGFGQIQATREGSAKELIVSFEDPDMKCTHLLTMRIHNQYWRITYTPTLSSPPIIDVDGLGPYQNVNLRFVVERAIHDTCQGFPTSESILLRIYRQMRSLASCYPQFDESASSGAPSNTPISIFPSRPRQLPHVTETRSTGFIGSAAPPSPPMAQTRPKRRPLPRMPTTAPSAFSHSGKPSEAVRAFMAHYNCTRSEAEERVWLDRGGGGPKAASSSNPTVSPHLRIEAPRRQTSTAVVDLLSDSEETESDDDDDKKRKARKTTRAKHEHLLRKMIRMRLK